MKRSAFVFALLLATSASAAEWTFGGHAKYQYRHTDYRSDDVNAVFGDDPANDQGIDLRLKAERRTGAWDVIAHYELLALHGATTETRRRLVSLGLLPGNASGLPDDRSRLFDLTHELSDEPQSAAVHRLDRLSLGYTARGQALRVGRQIVSWGNGLVFHPLDFVNPFSPVAIDKEYKTGDDMLYGQWTLGQRGDVQTILVPRRDEATRDVEREQSSLALKWRQRLGEFDVDLIVARHVDDDLWGAGFARSIAGAVWRLDASIARLNSGERVSSWVTNLDYSWVWGERNFYGYGEYFHNGFGETNPAGYVAPNAALSARIARGELYTLARDYLALGMQVELDALINLFTNVIGNLNDGSIYTQLRLVYDWRQDVQWMAGVEAPFGDRGDEFGGVPLAGTGAYSAPGRSVFLRIAYYF